MNRYKVLALAEQHGVAVKKQLKCWDKSGRLVVLTVDRPVDEVAAELRERGAL